MQLNELRPKHKPKKRKRVGRGGKHGTYSGRGMKGQGARSGTKTEPSIRALIKRYPKLRGYRYKMLGTKPEIAIINIDILEKRLEGNSLVTPTVLVEKGLIRKKEGKTPLVKILGEGKITKKLTVSGCRVSKSAKEKIEKAGGVIISEA